jgi:hypothetical protein
VQIAKGGGLGTRFTQPHLIGNAFDVVGGVRGTKGPLCAIALTLITPTPGQSV